MRNVLILILLAAVPASGAAPAKYDWVKALITPSARFHSEKRTVALYPTVPRGMFSSTPGLGTGALLEVTALFCVEDSSAQPLKVRCEGVRKDKPGPNELDAWENWLTDTRHCAKVELIPPNKELAAQVAASLQTTGLSGLPPTGSATKLTFIEVQHVGKERVYENGCEGVRGHPCDPAGSWPTNRFNTTRSWTSELVTSAKSTAVEYAFQPVSVLLHFPTYGQRTNGWFVPEEGFRAVADGTDAPTLLKTLQEMKTEDADAEVALALSRASAAIVAKDARAAQLAQAFLELARGRGDKVHFELRPAVRESLSVMEAVAAGRYVAGDPCKRPYAQ